MKKTSLFIALAVGVASAAQAQSARFGVKAGASLTGVTGKDTDGTAYKFGFNGGVMANFAINDMFSIQPEVLYSMKGAKDNSNSDNRINLNYIDVPVLAKVSTGATGLFFELGPQIGFLASAKAKTSSTTTDVKDGYKTVDFGYAAGLGFQTEGGAMVGLRYNGGFTNVGKSYTYSTPYGTVTADAGNAKNSAFQLYVGFLFGGK
ncbi:porin family protein [Hymenobacter ginsengisoli]|uniref:Porin family protein n=1 Tax=Hymenobacter ginsengisoli TaxID=1051626 RepID=A0ABP8QS83_9BACT|nr:MULTISPECIES: porin family protein [unclassified Hymenobacter]MBO2032980.1 PorT family protein [Hymenobacter sp. BT559]